MTLLYVLIAVLMILLVGFWAGRSQTNDTSRPEAGGDSLEGLLDGSGLSLAERIFDSGDYLWLHNEVGYPQLAQALLDWRKQMAIRWLKALRRSFDELVRTPEPVSPLENSEGAPSSWGLLWLTFRFHFLLTYALLVVRLFGPYHRLIPSASWLHSVPAIDRQKVPGSATGTGKMV